MNNYRNLNRNRELLAAFQGVLVQVPVLFLIGQRDVGLSIPGMPEIIADMASLAPHLRPVVELAGAELAVWRPPGPKLRSAILHLAAGIIFSMVAVEGVVQG